MDIHGARVTGPLTVDQARVFWRDGRLYVATSPTSVRVFDVPNEPEHRGGYWRAKTADGQRIQVQRPGCGCKVQAELRAMSQDALIAAAGALV